MLFEESVFKINALFLKEMMDRIGQKEQTQLIDLWHQIKSAKCNQSTNYFCFVVRNKTQGQKRLEAFFTARLSFLVVKTKSFLIFSKTTRKKEKKRCMFFNRRVVRSPKIGLIISWSNNDDYVVISDVLCHTASFCNGLCDKYRDTIFAWLQI